MNDSAVTIYADCQEKESPTLAKLHELGVHLRVGNLDVGSYVIGTNTVVLRMQAHQFTEAVIDGKLHHLVGKMVLSFPKAVVLIEGDVYSTKTPIAREAIDGALAFLVGVDCCSVLYCRNPTATADLIFRFARHAQKAATEALNFQRIKVRDEHEQALFTLCSVSGLGPVTAQNALEHFGSVFDFVNASVEDLGKVQGVGPKKSLRIHSSLRWRHNAQNLEPD